MSGKLKDTTNFSFFPSFFLSFLFFSFSFFWCGFSFLFLCTFIHFFLFLFSFTKNRLKDLNVRSQGLNCKSPNPKLELYKNGILLSCRFRFCKWIFNPILEKFSPSSMQDHGIDWNVTETLRLGLVADLGWWWVRKGRMRHYLESGFGERKRETDFQSIWSTIFVQIKLSYFQKHIWKFIFLLSTPATSTPIYSRANQKLNQILDATPKLTDKKYWKLQK